MGKGPGKSSSNKPHIQIQILYTSVHTLSYRIS